MTESTAAEYPPGMPTVDLQHYVRASQHDSAFVTECETRAAQLVADKVGTATVPPAVLSTAILEVAANLYQRRQSSIGTQSFGDPETLGNPMRPALDPLTPAWPLLRPYLGPGLA
ncbi:hypothetical protein [Brachybacterium sp. YJGR34]|uniref:hypothetical protein n=1 Tax=Brachybacterium sp. YJGR34 TaxID=2059911 RepID=UPI000E0B26B3|nr:hypothetical protein [Brachybacterium sp. YJGR34]